jgi:hypothetical protein
LLPETEIEIFQAMRFRHRDHVVATSITYQPFYTPFFMALAWIAETRSKVVVGVKMNTTSELVVSRPP